MDFYFQQTRRVPEKFSAPARSPPSRRKSNPYRTHNFFHFCMRFDPVPLPAAIHFRTAVQSLSCLGAVRLRTLSPDNRAREPIISAHISSWDYAPLFYPRRGSPRLIAHSGRSQSCLHISRMHADCPRLTCPCGRRSSQMKGFVDRTIDWAVTHDESRLNLRSGRGRRSCNRRDLPVYRASARRM
jgi:hypothetical protein